MSAHWSTSALQSDRSQLDTSVTGSYSFDEVSKCIHVGLLCVQDSSSARPLMSSVVSMLDSEAMARAIPKQPMYFAQINRETKEAREDLEDSNNGVSLMAIEGR
uniref:Uncharacterized protein n=1 Tax=Avena sativa TaxID=4498 RepID=A0ACD5V3B1_AVESA